MNSTLIRAFRFFSKHAGYVVGEHARCALQLARAEAFAKDRDILASWTYDECADEGTLGDHEYWCKDARRGREHSHEVLCCTLYQQCDEHAEYDFTDPQDVERCRRCYVIGSLSGIIDPDNNYRRVVEAELALDVMRQYGDDRDL